MTARKTYILLAVNCRIMGESTVVKVGDRGRVQLPKPLMEAIDIEMGDLVRITVEHIGGKNDC
jgi:hypothetical protein